MTGIPDAVVEAAAETLLTRNGHRWGASKRWDNFYRDLARAALAEAEGPWREHLATQIEALDRFDYTAEGLPTVELNDVLTIVRGIK